MLQRMLLCPNPKDEPLKEALKETFVMTEVGEPIRKYIKKA